MRIILGIISGIILYSFTISFWILFLKGATQKVNFEHKDL